MVLVGCGGELLLVLLKVLGAAVGTTWGGVGQQLLIEGTVGLQLVIIGFVGAAVGTSRGRVAVDTNKYLN